MKRQRRAELKPTVDEQYFFVPLACIALLALCSCGGEKSTSHPTDASSDAEMSMVGMDANGGGGRDGGSDASHHMTDSVPAADVGA